MCCLQSSPTEYMVWYEWVYRFHSRQHIFDLNILRMRKVFAFVRPSKVNRLKRCLFECFSRWNSSIYNFSSFSGSDLTFFFVELFFMIRLSFSHWKSSKYESFHLLFAFCSFQCLLQQSAKNLGSFIKTYDVGNCLIKLFISHSKCRSISFFWLRFQTLQTIYDSHKEFHMLLIYFHLRTNHTSNTNEVFWIKFRAKTTTNSIQRYNLVSSLFHRNWALKDNWFWNCVALSLCRFVAFSMKNQKLCWSNCWFRVQSPLCVWKLCWRKMLKVRWFSCLFDEFFSLPIFRLNWPQNSWLLSAPDY